MTTERALDDFRALAREAVPELDVLGTIEYSVFAVDGDNYDLRPTDPKYPPIPNCSVKPGIPGLRATMQVGALVYVSFANGKPARPIIVAVAGPDDAGFTPVSLSLVASGTVSIDGASIHAGAALAPVVRVGDTITVGTGVAGSNGATGVVAITLGLGVPPAPSRLLA